MRQNMGDMATSFFPPQSATNNPSPVPFPVDAPVSQQEELAKTAIYSVIGALGLYWLGVQPRTLVLLGLGTFALQAYKSVKSNGG